MSNWGVKRKIVLSVKFPDWNSMEDMYFCEKAKGYKVCVSNAYIYHHHRSTFKSYLQQNIRNGAGEIQYLRYKKDKKGIYGYIAGILGVIALSGIAILSQKYILVNFFLALYIGFLMRRYGIFKRIYKQYGFKVLVGSIILYNISVIGTAYGKIKEIVIGTK